MKHYQDHDPLHGHGKAIPKPQRPNNGADYYEPRVEVNRDEPRRPHTNAGGRGLLSVAMLMAATMSMGGSRR